MLRISETTQSGGSMAYLATLLTALVVRVDFVERVDRLVLLEMLLEEFEASFLCNG